jgi:hypothetical protein
VVAVAICLCLDTKAGDASNQGTIFQWTCNINDDAHQCWGVDGNTNITDNDNAELTLQDSTSGNGTCLAADAAEASDEGIIWQWTCSGYSSNKYLEWG